MNIRSIISLLCLSIGAFFFQACDDVPAPYDIPGKGEANSLYGNGSMDSPYTIKGASLNQNGGYAWIKAYIVGYIPSGADVSTTISDVTFGADGAGTTNIVIASTADSKDINDCMVVQLPAGDVRTALNLQAHPENLGKEVMLYGTMEKYFGASGVKSVQAAILDGTEIGDMPSEGGDALFSETFSEGLGEFTIKDVNLPAEMGKEVWVYDSQYKYLQATSYVNNTNYEAESWLVSPSIDLTQATAATLTFDYVARYFGSLTDNITVWATEAENENWTQLAVTLQEGSDWTFTSSGDIDLSAYKGKNVKIAIKYSCTTKAGTFELKNFKIEERNASAVVPPSGNNLLTTGGFEAWDNGIATGWSSTNSAGNATVTQSTDAKSGSYSAMIEGTTTANKRLASSEMTLKAGTYELSASFKAVDADASIRLGYALNEADGSIASGDSYVYGSYVNNITKDSWTDASYTFTLTADTRVNLVVMVGKNPGTSVLIDDVSLISSDGGIIDGGGSTPEEPTGAVLTESFNGSFGSFSTVNVTGTQVWSANASYGRVTMSAFANNVSVTNEDWLISPAFDLSKSRTLTIQQAFGPYNKSMDNASQLYTVWVSNDYAGDVNTATWQQVSINYPATSGWTFSEAQATLPAVGAKAYLAFKYKNADGDETLTWEVKSVTVQ
ncbi:MAG: DUF6359 domain-containing protein [Paraprevotella sp.]|nr:DUF6359 domain-containing protein [Paraprevotella sp.]